VVLKLVMFSCSTGCVFSYGYFSVYGFLCSSFLSCGCVGSRWFQLLCSVNLIVGRFWGCNVLYVKLDGVPDCVYVS
jgi:hypothetical protein